MILNDWIGKTHGMVVKSREKVDAFVKFFIVNQ